jgi:hypothetical protein
MLEDKLIIILILVIILIILLFLNEKKKKTMENNQNIENMINIKYSETKWNRNDCKYYMNQTYLDEFKKHNIQKDDKDWNLYCPCSYDNPKKEINNMPVVKGAKYFIIDNVDYLIAKEWLWKILVKHYGLDKTCTIMPKSYILNEESELDRFKQDFIPTKLYILKKNVQRQKGLKITNNKNEIINAKNQKFALVQELLQNPYLIDGHKINLRVYILVICKNNELNVYVHKDGFLYYTPKKFKKNSIDTDENITTGYIDRKIYEVNPLTHDDLRNYFDNPKRNLSNTEQNIRNQGLKVSQICFNRINTLIRDIFMAFVGKLGSSKKFSDNVMFQLFGADVAIDENLNAMIMEINKGPDMGAKDKRDSDLKHKVVNDILIQVGAIDKQKIKDESKFISVLEVKNGIVL